MLLGDPSKNVLARHFLTYFTAVNADDGLAISRTCTSDPATGRATFALRVGEQLVAEYESSLQPGSRFPSTDIGLIVAWLSPFSQEKRRAVLCTGWTSHGTAAAADYYLNHLLSVRYRQLRRDGTLPRLYSRRWPCFVCAVEVVLVGEQAVSVNEVFLAAVPDVLPATRLRGRTWSRDVVPDLAGANRDRDRGAD